MNDRIPDPDQAPRETFRADLPRRRGLRRGPRLAVVGAVCGFLLVVLAGAWLKLEWLGELPRMPADDQLWSYNRAPGMTFLDRKGVQIAVRGPRNGRRVGLEELPAYVPRAFLAAEDPRFYGEGPVDWSGLARAVIAQARGGPVAQDGPTLTQQLAKTLFAKPDPTLRRRIQEAALAVELSRRMSKDQILELYLNRVFFGSSAYGIEAAAETYFGKPASALSLSEAALLAALPKAPSRLSPAAGMPAALARSRLVLRRMAQEGWIGEADEARALASPPRLAPEPAEDEDFGYVLDLAQGQAAALAQGRAPDLVVRLTVDRDLQVTASQVVQRVMETRGRAAGADEAALVALAPDGGVGALVGGVDHRFSRFDRAVQAERQPGSAFAPFVYAAALDAGIAPPGLGTDAQAGAAARLARQLGADRITGLAERLGVQNLPPRPDLSVALGAYGTDLLGLTSAYQVFQQDGRRRPPYLISMITNSAGRRLYAHTPAPGDPVYDPGRAARMVRMLEGALQTGPGARAAFGRPAAGQAGASQDLRDAWFIGFTPAWAAGVWVGNDDDAPMSRPVGGELPGEIWRRFMTAAHHGLPVRGFAVPAAAAPSPPAPVRSAGPAPSAPPPARRAFYRGLADDLARADRNGALEPAR